MILKNKKMTHTSPTSGFPYLVYVARLTQSGTDNPVATILQNTIGDITWHRDAPGAYHASSSGLFTIDKTICLPFGDAENGAVFLPLSANTQGYFQINVGSDINNLGLGTFSDLNYTDVEWSSIGGNLTIEIRVYP